MVLVPVRAEANILGQPGPVFHHSMFSHPWNQLREFISQAVTVRFRSRAGAFAETLLSHLRGRLLTDFVLFQQPIQRTAIDPERAGGFGFVLVATIVRFLDVDLIQSLQIDLVVDCDNQFFRLRFYDRTGQILQFDPVVFGQDFGTLDRVLQLPDVARPAVTRSAASSHLHRCSILRRQTSRPAT